MPSATIKYNLGILTGGKSKRMGTDKALLPFGGTTVIEYLLNHLNVGQENTYISANTDDYAHLKLKVVKDNYPNCGPISGLEALLHISEHPLILISCDTPFISSELVKKMMNVYNNTPLVVKSFEGMIYPTLGVYPPHFHALVKTHIQSEKYSIYKILEAQNTSYITPECDEKECEKLLLNLNTPEDYKLALTYL